MSLLDNKKKARRKALENFLSGRLNPGSKLNPWEEKRAKLAEENLKEIETLVIPVSTKELKIRGRKKGKKTPRQTFRCDEALWRAFLKACRKKENKSASEILRRFIYKYTQR